MILKSEQPNPNIILETKTTKEATNAGVRQDKYPPGRIDEFSDQPQSADTPPISAKNTVITPKPPAENRPKHHGSETRQPPKFGDVRPSSIKAKILGMKEAQGLYRIRSGGESCAQGVQIDVDMQYGAMLRPVIRIKSTKTSKATATATPTSTCKRSMPQNRIGSYPSISFAFSPIWLTHLMN